MNWMHGAMFGATLPFAMGTAFMGNEKMKDDVICRQDAINDIKAIYEYHDTVTEDRIIDHLKRLPSAQPHWIPVKEMLPEETVLVTVETKTFRHRYICEAVWIPRWTWKASFDNWEDCSEYNEDEDEYYVNEGWYERVHNWDEYSYVGIEDDVLAWMPLPEPYKEGQDDQRISN